MADIINKHDEEYLKLCNRILTRGIKREDRTKTNTLSIFGERIEFDLNTFPLLTTKRVYWKGVLHELLWFLSGSSDVTILQKNNINIWNGNTSEDFVKKNNLNVEPNDIGAGYGFQWRHFGANYKTFKKINNGIDNDPNLHNENLEKNNIKFVDQIKEAINLIKNDPWSRRIIVDAWDPLAIKERLVALPPCHCLFQFYVDPIKKTLQCQMYQRSCDVFLGLPFNIASYALLTYMIAHITNLKPEKLIIVIGDAHIYSTHIDQIKEQLNRSPLEYPTLSFNRNIESIDDFKYDDFNLNYKSQSTIKAKMAV